MQSRAFIGTQGPLPCTFDAFWKMIWEQRVSIIVMITNLVERGRRKCDMYWPKAGIESYGVIQVKLVREDVMATYTVRTFQIRHLKAKKKKQFPTEKFVYQYHYTNWPDHGTPDHPLPVLDFVRKSSEANPPDAGPVRFFRTTKFPVILKIQYFYSRLWCTVRLELAGLALTSSSMQC